MTNIITYGTFDVLHYGHIELLRRAKSLGDFLVVGLSSDNFNLIKHKQTHFDYTHRKNTLEAIKYVDLIIEESCWEQKIADVLQYKIDIFVIGDDWRGKFDFLQEYCKVIYLSRTKNISSTQIREMIGNV